MGKNNTIIKNKPTSDFTILPNSFIRDRRLSPQAVGVGAILGSLPANWSLSKEGLKAISGINRTRIDSAFKELESAGYLHVGNTLHGEKGHFSGKEYTFNAFAHAPTAENLQTVPVAEKPQTEKPQAENLQLQNKDTQIKDLHNKDYTPQPPEGACTVKAEVLKSGKKTRKQNAFVPPALEEVQAYVTEKGYTTDPQYFFDYYNAQDWKDACGNQVKNWKGKLVTWERRNQQNSSAFRWTAPTGATCPGTDPIITALEKAASNARYGAVEEFEALPKGLQEVVDSPSVIRSWGNLDKNSLSRELAKIATEYRTRVRATA